MSDPGYKLTKLGTLKQNTPKLFSLSFGERERKKTLWPTSLPLLPTILERYIPFFPLPLILDKFLPTPRLSQIHPSTRDLTPTLYSRVSSCHWNFHSPFSPYLYLPTAPKKILSHYFVCSVFSCFWYKNLDWSRYREESNVFHVFEGTDTLTILMYFMYL